jgi:predicted RNA-binding Zn-ribbon protein involved in translation (DUF1610 family)
MPKNVCVNCEIELKPETNGVVVAEMMKEDTEIYKLWMADLYKCPQCGVEIVLGFSSNPLMEHFEGDIDFKFNQLEASGKKIIFLKEKM